MTQITDFDSLLAAARAQPDPQRLLFVFARAVLHDDHQPQEAERFHAGQGGILQPVLCVDKTPEELTSFTALAAESARTGERWQLMFVAAIGGSGGKAPSSDDAEEPLKRMIQTIQTGGDVSRYLAFDHQGEPVRFL
ncbi:hypothetical protein [Pseudogulbenkiania sp. MAI-1]|uniref:hypothetical protein n=1 Tax=Pseudogulbenkiania sp. MAI-1 TaxID=990370 RepID=UPI00045E8881|nr:hypothetical protein [Pseudogulbenkiania sp. MAI-1]